jgi:hypothetical protein
MDNVAMDVNRMDGYFKDLRKKRSSRTIIDDHRRVEFMEDMYAHLAEFNGRELSINVNKDTTLIVHGATYREAVDGLMAIMADTDPNSGNLEQEG